MNVGIYIWVAAIYFMLMINGCQQHQDLVEIKQEIVKLRKVINEQE